MYSPLRHDVDGHVNMPQHQQDRRVPTDGSGFLEIIKINREIYPKLPTFYRSFDIFLDQVGEDMPDLHIYVSDCCWACKEARSIVADIKPQFPQVHIELRDLEDSRKPSQVFATPTYILDGRTIYLGNPTREELAQKLTEASTAS